MPIDTSIYQVLRPTEMPSMLDSMSKAQGISNVGLQQAHTMQQMESEAKKSKFEDMQRKATIMGPDLEHLMGLPEQEQAAQFPAIRTKWAKEGLVGPEWPEQFDRGILARAYKGYSQSKEYLDRHSTMAEIENKKANTDKARADAAKARSEATTVKLPPENKTQVDKLATQTANKVSIRGQLMATLKSLRDPSIPYDQKYIAGMNLGKTLNSTEGQDALAEGEAGRLLAFLNTLPRGRPGWEFGPQIEKFADQVALKVDDIGQSIASNRQEIDRLSGRDPNSAQINQVPTEKNWNKEPGGLVKSAQAGQNQAAPVVDQSALKAEIDKRAAARKVKN